MISLDDYRVECRNWLAARCEPAVDQPDDSVAVFRNLTPDQERELLRRGAAWQVSKLDAGFGAIDWPVESGGAGLTQAHAQVFREEELRFAVPESHESLRITVNLAAPTVREVGTAQQRDRFARSFLTCEELVCQLFSEPDAGSDLAAVATRAVRSDEHWIVNGSKVWTSGARFADWGVLIARTDPAAPKHKGLSAFLLAMDTPGVEVRPIRQMSGGESFSEVFLTDVEVPDDLRLGDPGAGWSVALTMLGFERNQSGSKKGVGGSWPQLKALALRSDRRDDGSVRRLLVDVYMHERLRELTRARAEGARLRGTAPGPEGSIGKLLWTEGLTMISDAASVLLGPELLADSGSPGTFAWGEHVLGAPGFRIAGGSDEIQRNIIGERVLGLPPEPREIARS